MSKKNNYTIDDLKLFIAQTINEEMDNHAKALGAINGYTVSFSIHDEIVKIMNAIHKAKVDTLHKIYSEAQKVQ